jgi:hypothetical protein
MVEKYYRDGKVAVLYSPGYGAGWYTWNYLFPDCIFDKDIVELVLERDELKKEFVSSQKYGSLTVDEIVSQQSDHINDFITKIDILAHDKYGDNFYTGGARSLVVEFLEPGTQFKIDEYDGSERLVEVGKTEWLIA